MITHSGETPYRCKLENKQRRLQTGHMLLLHSVSFQGNCFLKGRKRRGSQSYLEELDCKLPPRCPCNSCPIAVTAGALTVPRTDQRERKLRTKHIPVQCSTWWCIKNTNKKNPHFSLEKQMDIPPVEKLQKILALSYSRASNVLTRCAAQHLLQVKNPVLAKRPREDF